jgi:NADH-quinone oxidoreductase subunit M
MMAAGIGGAAAAFLAAIAVMIRKGIVPLHSWLPDLFERAPLALSVLFNAPQIGAWVAVRVVAPHAPLWVLEMISLAALLTAVHGAGMALVQTAPRRVLGWLFLSQSALILVGLESRASVAQAGGMAMWISSGLALTGFGMTLAALEARRGPLSLLRFGGGYERKPLLAVCFLMLGLASAGFPGTLGFVAQEALVHGVVRDFPYLGFAVLAASMLNGITVLRMYFTLFCGRVEADRVPQPLQWREQLAFVMLVVLLVAGGMYPRPFLWSPAAAVEESPRGALHANSKRAATRAAGESSSPAESALKSAQADSKPSSSPPSGDFLRDSAGEFNSPAVGSARRSNWRAKSPRGRRQANADGSFKSAISPERPGGRDLRLYE